MPGFDWNDVKSFLAVARSGRLTAAAHRLQIDHTTLSRRLAALEHALKAKLAGDSASSAWRAKNSTRVRVPSSRPWVPAISSCVRFEASR